MFAKRPDVWVIILEIRWSNMSLGIILSGKFIRGPTAKLKQRMDPEQPKRALSQWCSVGLWSMCFRCRGQDC